MTDEEKKQLVDAIITQLKSEGTDVSNANIVSNANGIDYVVAYGKNGQIVRAVPTAISSEKVGASGYMNAYTEAGVYNINTFGGEDLPIDNQGAISARLTVLVTESGGNKVITQVLNLNDNDGGEGNVYIRSCQNGEWKAWGKLQTNIEVEELIEKEKTRAEQEEEDIRQNSIASGSFVYSTTTNDISLEYETLDGRSTGSITFPAATTEKAGVMSAADKVTLDSILNEIDKIKDGNTIVGQAREIHSRNGKTITDSFLARTTAGSGTIGDGVASLKSVGGNIVKNLVNGTSRHFFTPNGQPYHAINSDTIIVSHIHYATAVVYNYDSNNVQISVGGGWINNVGTQELNKCVRITSYGTGDSRVPRITLRVNSSDNTSRHIYILQYLAIDLTEMFGAGNEPDQATCDKLFGTMDALPKGLTIAKPNTFTSIGFNQFNPDNVLEGKAIVDNVIVPGDKKIAVIPCLPCKVGIGENNGYCIHGDFGNDINVYLTPLNPMDVDGELYMHKLTMDATTDTYVPLIKGYMLVEVPTTANLCAHFLWSEDKCERDSYEPYHESKVGLPVIPQISEWGLAGIQTGGTLACDEIDFERGVYVKRIGVLDVNFFKEGNIANVTPKGALVFEMTKAPVGVNNHISNSDYRRATPADVYNTKEDKLIYIGKSGWFNANLTCVVIYDAACKNKNDVINAFADVKIYYELATPEEYPLPKVDNNYISSDYGVEQFDSNIPCNANNLYYMRSLAGETRNFLDRLMAGLGTSDATVVADRILAVVNPAVEPANVEPETPIEE